MRPPPAPWRTALTLVAIAGAVAAVVAASTWLLPRGDVVPVTPAPPADADSSQGAAAPGAIACPEAPPAQPSAGLLIDCPDAFDGRRVTYEGEVVEAVVRRGADRVAIVNDDVYGREGPLPQTRTAQGGNSGIAVIMPAGTDDDIMVLGSYRARGDLIRVDGTFTPASDLLGGQPAIVADAVEVIRPGAALIHPPDTQLAAAAAVAAAAAAIAAALAHGARRP